MIVFLFPFTPCVYLWEHPRRTSDHKYKHPTNQLNKAAPQTANCTEQVMQAGSEEEKERTGEKIRDLWGRSLGINERWHAGHLNAKAEGNDLVSITRLNRDYDLA